MTNPTHPQQPIDFPLADQLFAMILAIATNQSIFVAAKLGIADLLKDGPKCIEELADATGAHARPLYRVMRFLASLGIFAEKKPRHFTLSPLAERLQTDTHGSLRGLAIVEGSEYLVRAWSNLLHSVQSGEVAFERTFGMNFFEYLQQHPAESAIFHDALTSTSEQDVIAICDAYDFSDFRTIVDVGGGHGLLLATILKSYPSLKGILFDQPAVVEGAHGAIQAEGMNDRCQIVGGDFFTEVPLGKRKWSYSFAGMERSTKGRCRIFVARGHGSARRRVQHLGLSSGLMVLSKRRSMPKAGNRPAAARSSHSSPWPSALARWYGLQRTAMTRPGPRPLLPHRVEVPCACT
ncbi:acetylserotonin O-methyltransferase [Acidobacteria bacterium AH-259-A15]|nr:acetylserotonin O-methyltransferase [Acidobacteria bacterium AH-259-A15]